MSESLLKKAEELAAKVGKDVETVFEEFEAWVEGKKEAECDAPKEAEQAPAATEAPAAEAEPAAAETPAEEPKAE